MNNSLLELVGKIVKGETKRPNGDLVDAAIEVSAVVVVPTPKGDATYLFGVTADGTVGLTNLRYWFADSVKAEPSPSFRALSLEDWFMCPPDSGVFDPHFAHSEKVSKKAQKRLPANALKLTDYTLKPAP